MRFPNSFSSFETERLILNEISMNDVDFLFELRNNDDVNKYIGRKKSSLEAVKQFIMDRISDFKEKKGITWMIYNKATNQNMGSICFWNFDFDKDSAEIGYELSPEFHGKGFMQEALSKVINFGFNELNLQTIEAFTDKNNKPSINALVKFNFIEEVTFKSIEVESLIMFKLTSTQL
ncbi:MAG: GNAT family N-acetyltransferase [Bacteroidota bacterium]